MTQSTTPWRWRIVVPWCVPVTMVPMQPERRSLSTCLAQILSALGQPCLVVLGCCVISNKWLKIWSNVLKFCTKYSVCLSLVFLTSVGCWMIDLAQIVGRLLLSQAEVANTILSLSIIWCQAKIDPSSWNCSQVISSNHFTWRCPCITPLPKRWRRPCDLGYKGCRSLRGEGI